MAKSDIFQFSTHPCNRYISKYYNTYTANVADFLNLLSSIVFIFCPLCHCHLFQHCCYYSLLLSFLLFHFPSLISLTSHIICENVGLFIDIFYFYRKIPNILSKKLIKSNQTALHKDWEIKEQ